MEATCRSDGLLIGHWSLVYVNGCDHSSALEVIKVSSCHKTWWGEFAGADRSQAYLDAWRGVPHYFGLGPILTLGIIHNLHTRPYPITPGSSEQYFLYLCGCAIWISGLLSWM